MRSQRRISIAFEIFLDAEILVREGELRIEIHGILQNLFCLRPPANCEKPAAIGFFLGVGELAHVKVRRPAARLELSSENRKM